MDSFKPIQIEEENMAVAQRLCTRAAALAQDMEIYLTGNNKYTLLMELLELKQKIEFEALRGNCAPQNFPFRKRVCIDFDGVIHSYHEGWKGATNIYGHPLEGAKEFLKACRFADIEVVILSTRACPIMNPGGKDAIEDWMEKHELHYDDVTSNKVPSQLYIDDRALNFNTHEPEASYRTVTDTLAVVAECDLLKTSFDSYRKGEKPVRKKTPKEDPIATRDLKAGEVVSTDDVMQIGFRVNGSPVARPENFSRHEFGTVVSFESGTEGGIMVNFETFNGEGTTTPRRLPVNQIHRSKEILIGDEVLMIWLNDNTVEVYI